MQIYVCVKHVPDTAANIKIVGENGFDDGGCKFIANPYDEYALEEAVRLVESQGGEVVVVNIVGNVDWSQLEKLAEALDPKWPGPVPYTVLIAPGGKVIYRQHDSIDPLELKKAIVVPGRLVNIVV